MQILFSQAVFRRAAAGFFVCLLLLAAIPASMEGTSILLTFTGDCTLGSEEHQFTREGSFISLIKEKGFAYPFANFKAFFEEDDLTVINLENVFTDSKNNRADKTYLFRAPTSHAAILKEGSVELAFIANNHILDYGKQGMLNTIRAVEEQGVKVFGSNNSISLGHIYEKDGIKVGFLGTYQAFWYIGKDSLTKILNSFREAGCHAVVAIIHDGTEYSFTRNKKQQQMGSWLAKNGVDLVVGHHPHVVQGVDIVGNTTVLYSLGNFSFGGNKSLDIARRPGIRADKALVARVELKFDENKAFLGHQVRLYPVSPSGTADFNDYQPRFLAGQEALDTLALVQGDTAFTLPAYVEGQGVLLDFVPAAQDEPAE